MNKSRKFGLWLAVLLLTPLLTLGLFMFIFHQTVGQPQYVKDTLAEAKVYEAFGSYAKTEFSKSPEVKQQPELQNAVESAVDPQITRQVIEKTVDDTYLVLNGDKSADTLVVDISPIQDAFLTTVESDLGKYLNSLPTCTTFNGFDTENPFASTCLPPGVTAKQVTDQTIDTIVNDNEALKSAEISLDEEQGENNGNGSGSIEATSAEIGSPIEALELAGSTYRFTKIFLPIALVLSLFAAAGIVILSRPRIKGVRRAGWILAANGLIITAASVFLNMIASNFAAKRATDNDTLGTALEDTIRAVVLDSTSLARNIGIALLIIGLAMAITAIVILKKRQPEHPPKLPQTKNDAMTPPTE